MVPETECHASVTGFLTVARYQLARARVTTASRAKENALTQESNLIGGPSNHSPTSVPPALAQWLIRLLTVLFLLPVGIAAAQTVSVSPSGYITAPLGGTVPFTATVTGLSNQNV